MYLWWIHEVCAVCVCLWYMFRMRFSDQSTPLTVTSSSTNIETVFEEEKKKSIIATQCRIYEKKSSTIVRYHFFESVQRNAANHINVAWYLWRFVLVLFDGARVFHIRNRRQLHKGNAKKSSTSAFRSRWMDLICATSMEQREEAGVSA